MFNTRLSNPPIFQNQPLRHSSQLNSKSFYSSLCSHTNMRHHPLFLTQAPHPVQSCLFNVQTTSRFDQFYHLYHYHLLRFYTPLSLSWTTVCILYRFLHWPLWCYFCFPCLIYTAARKILSKPKWDHINLALSSVVCMLFTVKAKVTTMVQKGL